MNDLTAIDESRATEALIEEVSDESLEAAAGILLADPGTRSHACVSAVGLCGR